MGPPTLSQCSTQQLQIVVTIHVWRQTLLEVQNMQFQLWCSRACVSVQWSTIACPSTLSYVVAVAPEIVVPPKSTIAAVGMDIFLDCVAAGAPPPSITWLKDGELLLDCVEEMESNVCVNESVIITGAQPDNQGVYSCVAQNPLGISVYDVIVSVGTAPCM